ncbi:MAG: hypothetical protein E2598_09710 [Sphingobium sp.]|nr:hypothetical protein [Sphingobium sp.]
MDLELLLTHYFGTVDLEQVDETSLVLGQEKLALDFGTEQEPGRRFALWVLMEALGSAPVPADAFAKPEEAQLRSAAEEYLTTAWRMEQRGEGE